MRKPEIQPGVVYAYQRGRGGWDTPTPIVFLTTPADGVLYTEASRYKNQEDPQYIRDRESSKPQRGTWGKGDTGYPAVQPDWGTSADPAELLKPTLEDFEKATTYVETGVPSARFALITNLAAITGPYDEVLAAWNARKETEHQQREQDHAWRTAIANRADRISVRLAQYGVDATADQLVQYGADFTADHTDRGYLKISLDDAELLLAVLDGNPAHDA